MASHSFIEPLFIDDDRLASLSREFSKLFAHLARNSTEQFLATPVNVLPSGTESGRFLAIDVGGSNLRVGFVELGGKESTKDNMVRVKYEKSWSIEDHFKIDNAEQLFSWIGSCIALVVADCMLDLAPETDSPRPLGDEIPIGITFSFPMMQSSISEATLMPMGKGFAITSDLNLGKLLLSGYSQSKATEIPFNDGEHHSSEPRRLKLPDIRIAAITNDTVATLASLAYSAEALSLGKVAMGLIVGTGTNSSIIWPFRDLHETKQNSVTLPYESDTSHTSVVVNTEWTINGAAPPLHQFNLITRWDEQLDREGETPGFQPFEYMTAGRYLGELARLILRDYLLNVEEANESALPKVFKTWHGLPTLFLSRIVAQAESAAALLPTLKEEFPPHLDIWQWNENHAQLFIDIANGLRHRSARMVAAAVVGLLASARELTLKDDPSNSTGSANGSIPADEVIVAYAGGVISSFPKFLDTCQQTINELVDTLVHVDYPRRVVLKDANKGGILGAGVLAATVWNLPTTKRGSLLVSDEFYKRIAEATKRKLSMS